MATFDIASAGSGLLKEVYLPPLRELLNNSTVLLKYLEKEIQETEGKNFHIPLHTSRNEAAGDGRTELATLPVAGKQGYGDAQVPAKYLYSRIAVSGPVIAATKSNKGSFLRALDAEMRGIAKDTRRSFNRQLNSDGRDALGFIVSTADPTYVVDDGLGTVGGDFFNSGAQLVDVINGSTNAVRQNDWTATRAGLVATGRNITRTAGTTAGVAVGDYFTRRGALAAPVGTGTNQMTGIAAVISDGNPVLNTNGLHGVTVAANPDWVAQIVYGAGSAEALTAAGRVDLSFPLMQQVFSQISANSDFSEEDIKLILVSYPMRDAYVQLCRNERVFYNNMKLDGGFSAVSYNQKPIVPDVHARHYRMQFICPDSMSLFRLADLDWMEKDGNVLYRLSGGDVDGYGATLFVYQELGCKVRNANGALLNINE